MKGGVNALLARVARQTHVAKPVEQRLRPRVAGGARAPPLLAEDLLGVGADVVVAEADEPPWLRSEGR